MKTRNGQAKDKRDIRFKARRESGRGGGKARL